MFPNFFTIIGIAFPENFVNVNGMRFLGSCEVIQQMPVKSVSGFNKMPLSTLIEVA